MNSTSTSVGGWPASNMRKFVTPIYDENNVLIEDSGTIYNALPKVIRNNIIDTRVISGYESGKSENYTSIDKLYLLSLMEVYGSVPISNNQTTDKVSTETRRLDYYTNMREQNKNNSGAIKYLKGTVKTWWTCSADARLDTAFFAVYTNGNFSSYTASIGWGVSPAFRLG